LADACGKPKALPLPLTLDKPPCAPGPSAPPLPPRPPVAPPVNPK
jgi:hypothetical protein